MPTAVTIQLEATRPAALDQFTGRGVHGFWFDQWKQVNSRVGDLLHGQAQDPSFTLSPLMGLRDARDGKVLVRPGDHAWLRLSILSDELAEVVRTDWLPSLPPGFELSIPKDPDQPLGPKSAWWKIIGIGNPQAKDDPLFQSEDYLSLSRKHLEQTTPPTKWQLDFLTPTTFHGKNTHLPFPLPDSLVGSWLRRWQYFSPLGLPSDELMDWTRAELAVSSYNLRTLSVREGERERVGCLGRITLTATKKSAFHCACLDLLADYANYCGSGSHTTQGMGQTRLLSSA